MPTKRAFTPEDLVRVRRLSGLELSPDGRSAVLAVDERSGDGKRYDTNYLRLDLERDGSDGAEPTPLTATGRRKGRVRFASDGRLFALMEPDPTRRRGPDAEEEKRGDSADDDDEPLQLHLFPAGGGEPACLTGLPRGVQDFQVCADGTVVLLAAVDPKAKDLDDDRQRHADWKKRKETGVVHEAYPIRFWDHFEGPAHPHLLKGRIEGTEVVELEDLTPDLAYGLHEPTLALSPDERTLAVDWTVVDEDLRRSSRIVLVDLASGEKRELTGTDPNHGSPAFSPDGRRIACNVHPDRPRVTGKSDLAIVDVASGGSRVISAGLDLWPQAPHWIDDSTILFEIDEAGHHGLRTIDVESGESRPLIPEGHVAEPRARARDRSVVFLHDDVTRPADVFRVGVDGGEPIRLTNLNPAFSETFALGSRESHVVAGDGGTDVQLWEVRPPDFDPKKKYPLLLWIHGGPLGAFVDQFHYRWNPQLFAARGWLVVMANPRGSTGFGQDFIEGNNGEWGGPCFRDLMKVVDAWQEKPHVDADRMAACGASFGGYMVNWIAGNDARFRCLVSHAGLYHLPAFWGTTDAGPEWELEFGGVPWANPELYEKWSPAHHAGAFETPTLVIHGELDYRVPLGEGLQMFHALQRMRVPSKLLYFPDENHWILKPANLVQWNDEVIAWLERWLA